MSKTLIVEACAGRSVPIHAVDNPTGGGFILLPEAGSVELFDSPGVRRRIRAGDLRRASTIEPRTLAPGEKLVDATPTPTVRK